MRLALDLLRTHRATLDALANELVDKEMITAPRLAEILAETSGKVAAEREPQLVVPAIPTAPAEAPVAV